MAFCLVRFVFLVRAIPLSIRSLERRSAEWAHWSSSQSSDLSSHLYVRDGQAVLLALELGDHVAESIF
jgi:hypothetical protein